MCSRNEMKMEGKIKGDGTGASLMHCLHIGFGGTRRRATVPWKCKGIVSIDVLACFPGLNPLTPDQVGS